MAASSPRRCRRSIRPGSASNDGALLRVGPDIVSAVTAVACFQGTLAALHERGRSGKGQIVDVSMLCTALFARLPMWSVLGEPDEWVGHLCDSYALPPDYGYSTADGHVDFSTNRMKESQYVEFLTRLDLIDRARGDARFDIEHSGAATSFAGAYGKEFMTIWSQAFSRFTTAEITDLVNELGGSATPMHDLGQLLTAPQIVANNLVTHVDSQGVSIPVVRPPLIGAGTLWGLLDDVADSARRSMAGVA